jgi:hypothetical protein
MFSQKKINPCRPGYGASCAFCCGSHNYILSPEKIEEIFENRGLVGSLKLMTMHPEESTDQKLVRDGMQCPHIGISPSEPGIVCCLSYMDDDRPPAFKSFFSGTCKNFYCAAWSELSERQILFAAELTGDWYYYSLLINCTDILSELCSDYEKPRDVPRNIFKELKLELVKKLNEDDLI